jgi:hypothetical protein
LNAYQWRGRVRRRSGYTTLGRLELIVTIPGGTFPLVAGVINLLTAFGLPATSSIVPGSIDITNVDQGTVYTDPAMNGVLVPTGGTGIGGSINYATGVLTITAGGGSFITGTFGYYPGLPVMGLRTKEGFNLDVQEMVAFDTVNAYDFNGSTFELLPSIMPVTWHGTDYNFFFTTNYADAFWVTNDVPGLNGWKITNVPTDAFTGSAGVGNLAVVTVNAPGNAVAIGDYVYFLNLIPNVAANADVLAIVTVSGNPFTVRATNLPSTSTFAWTDGPSNTGLVLDSMKAGITLNGKPQDGIRYYGILTNGTGWANYNPPIDLNNALAGALLIFPYRGYLVFLNTWEGNDLGVFNYGNRARWTEIGTPYYSFPVPQNPNIQGVDINAVRDDFFGRGGANDAATGEVIIGAEFIRDILIVYFERSTWRLRFANNAQNPFVWERVNIELGSSCTFSSIPFDKGLMAISNRGIVISDGNDTTRFDEKIPDDFFDIRQSNNGFQRVYGIRTFRTKLSFWTFPSTEDDLGIYPDKVLVFNYETKNWSFFDDSFTCFGYYYPAGVGLTWGDLPNAWSSYIDISWNSGVSEAGYENIVAGNQQGYVLIYEQPGPANSNSLFISSITAATPGVFTSPNNNLPVPTDGDTGTWITLTGIIGTTSDDGVSLNGRNFYFNNPTLDPNTFTLSEFKSIDGGLAVGVAYAYIVRYLNIIPGSIQINIGALVFTDPDVNGILVEASGLGSGTINYLTGLINLTFAPAIVSTEVYIRVVTLDPRQEIVPVTTIGVYGGGGQITKISGIDIQSKYFNFFGDNQRARLSKIDFYVDRTTNGQFTANIYGDSSNEPINSPLPDNPFSNVVLTSPNPYQIGQGEESTFRLYCDALASTLQMQFTLTDAQMAVNCINQSDIQLLALMVTLRRGGRLI